MVFNYVIVIYVFSYPEGYPDYYERGERRWWWWWWWGCASSLCILSYSIGVSQDASRTHRGYPNDVSR